MPKKPTEENIRATAELTIRYEGSVRKAIESFEKARQVAKESASADSDRAEETFDRLIKYCEER